MSGYRINREINEITGRWNHGHCFEAANDYEAIQYAMGFLEGERVFKLARTGYRGIEVRTVIDCTGKVA